MDRSTIEESCRAHGAAEHKSRAGLHFASATEMIAALAAADIKTVLPDTMLERPASVTFPRSRLCIEVAALPGDPRPGPGWIADERLPLWYLIVGAISNHSVDHNWDHLIRAVETPDGHDAGMWLRTKTHGRWGWRSRSSIRNVLLAHGLSKPDADKAMGGIELEPWTLVCDPFGPPENPQTRTWNLNAPQLRVEPAAGPHPNWDMVLSHVGQELDQPIRDSAWARSNGIKCGRDYLVEWIAHIVRHAEIRLPYLFLFGPENCGKSILHESIAQCLFTAGVVKADRALTSQNDFNGELVNCVIAVIEEKDVSRAPGASAKIKDAVTALELSIRQMRRDSYQITNLTHWIQCSNTIAACPIGWGDTRIVCLEVAPLDNVVGKDELMRRLHEEASAFAHTLLTTPLSETNGRLAMEVITTPSKIRATEIGVPELVLGIVELMSTRVEWSGASGELRAELGIPHPSDLRIIQAMLSEHRAYLRAHRVAFETSERRTKRGRLLTFRKIIGADNVASSG